MNPGWWGAVAVVVVGAAVVWLGWWNDRRRNRAASEVATKPIRTIPGLTAEPTYVTEAEIRALPIPTIPDAGPIARPDDAATLPAGVADAWFLRAGFAGLDHPDVLALEADLAADRDVATLLMAAKRRGRPLVIVAPGFSPAVLGTLRANAAKGTVSTLPLRLEDAAGRRRAVALTGGRLRPGRGRGVRMAAGRDLGRLRRLAGGRRRLLDRRRRTGHAHGRRPSTLGLGPTRSRDDRRPGGHPYECGRGDRHGPEPDWRHPPSPRPIHVPTRDLTHRRARRITSVRFGRSPRTRAVRRTPPP